MVRTPSSRSASRSAGAQCECPIQREALGRLQHAGARADACQQAGLSGSVQEAAAEADVPAIMAVAIEPVSYTHLRAHETPEHLVCRLLLEKKNTNPTH